MPDDSELLEQIRRGDQAAEGAYRTLLDRHARYLFGIAHSLTRGHASDAEDLVQETFMGALTSAGHFRGESSVRTWLVKILINRAAMLRRTRMRHPESALPASVGSGSGSGGQSGTDAKLDLSTMLEALSDDHREVIILRELQGMSYEEMARTLDVPRGTVESRLHRAREELRKKFKGYL